MADEEKMISATGPDRRVLLLSAGASHSVALLTGNVVCSWGRGEDGQLGHGDAEDRLSPTQMSELDGHEIVSITCGADHTAAYSEALMQVYSWGWGDFGRLGHGNSSDLFTPQPIKALQGVMIKQIACGDSHCLAVTIEGEVQRLVVVGMRLELSIGAYLSWYSYPTIINKGGWGQLTRHYSPKSTPFLWVRQIEELC